MDRLENAIREVVPEWSLADAVVAMQAVRGIDLIAAVGVLAEIGDLSRFQKRAWWACRALSVKTLNVGARHGGIASRNGTDTDRVDFARHSAVRAFPHVHHHRGYRLSYPANPEKRERALLAPLNVLSSHHCR